MTLADDTVTPGEPSITAPANGADTNSRAITGTNTAGDTVQVTITPATGGAAATGAATVTDTTWRCTPSPQLADGRYTVTATQTAPGDTASATSAPDMFTLDTTAPAAPSTPSDASVRNGYVNAANDTASQTITGAAEAGSTVRVYDNGTFVDTTAATPATGAWSYQVGTLPNGPSTATPRPRPMRPPTRAP